MNKKYTLKQIHDIMIKYLKDHGIKTPILDTQMFLMDVLGYEKKVDLYINADLVLSEAELEKLRKYLKKRIKHEPVQYITNKAYFYNEEFYVEKGVLIPRRESEFIVEETLRIVEKSPKNEHFMLDIGTGSGNLAISIVNNCKKKIRAIAIDISLKALFIARLNIKKYKLQSKILPLCCNIKNPSLKPNIFDIIVSNPPYISKKDYTILEDEVKLFEPKTALWGGENGLSVIIEILQKGFLLLKNNGFLIMEIGYDQMERLKNIVKTDFPQYEIVSTINDYSNIPRVISLRIKK